ncbi:MAG: hypothetical protein R6U89_09020 [Dehalococcoidia bacterium]
MIKKELRSRRTILAVMTGVLVTVLLVFATPQVAYEKGYGEPKFPVIPSVKTGEADEISGDSARLNGTLRDTGTDSNVAVLFEWGLKTPCEFQTGPRLMTSAGTFSATITDLEPSTTYYFRVKAVGDGVGLGDYETFKTTPLETPSADKPENIVSNTLRTIRFHLTGENPPPTRKVLQVT